MNKHEWQSAAYNASRRALKYLKGQPFVSETLLAAVLNYVPEPHDRRSFGSVIRRLKSDGIIVPAGVGRAKTSHGAIKPKWRAA